MHLSTRSSKRHWDFGHRDLPSTDRTGNGPCTGSIYAMLTVRGPRLFRSLYTGIMDSFIMIFMSLLILMSLLWAMPLS